MNRHVPILAIPVLLLFLAAGCATTAAPQGRYSDIVFVQPPHNRMLVDEEVIQITFDDAVKVVGQPCTCVAAGFCIAHVALEALCGDDLPVRGELGLVASRDHAVSDVVAYILGVERREDRDRSTFVFAPSLSGEPGTWRYLVADPERRKAVQVIYHKALLMPEPLRTQLQDIEHRGERGELNPGERDLYIREMRKMVAILFDAGASESILEVAPLPYEEFERWFGSGGHQHPEPEPAGGPALLVDTDMALDDVRALYALLAGGVEIEAFSIVGGSASAGRGTDNLLGLLESVDIHDVPVLRGSPSPGPPPPWRATVESLAGAPFPPPRVLVAESGIAPHMKPLLGEHSGEIEVLALGPLTNLRELEQEHPGSLERLDHVWMPVKRTPDGTVECWNLEADPAAASEVFDSVREVVLVDVSAVHELDIEESLSSVRGETPAATWIQDSLVSLEPVHWMFYDELAAVGMLHPDLLVWDDQRYRVVSRDGGRFVLEAAEDGNVLVTGIRDAEQAVAHLQELWQSPIEAHVHEHPATAEAVPVRDFLKGFHGHLGPYVVLGYRMGQLALEALEAEGHFDLSGHVHSQLQVPPSCLIDGIQLGSGCTLGKRNIEIFETGDPAWAEFSNDDGARVVVRLRPEIPELVRLLVEKKGVESAGEELLGYQDEALFEIEHPSDR